MKKTKIKYSKSRKYELITTNSGVKRYVSVKSIKNKIDKLAENHWKARVKNKWLGGDISYHWTQLKEEKAWHKKMGHEIKIKYLQDGYSVIYWKNK